MGMQYSDQFKAPLVTGSVLSPTARAWGYTTDEPVIERTKLGTCLDFDHHGRRSRLSMPGLPVCPSDEKARLQPIVAGLTLRVMDVPSRMRLCVSEWRRREDTVPCER